MKKVLKITAFFLLAFALCTSVFADEVEDTKKINVYVFSKEGCPHCNKLKTFLESLKEDKELKDMFNVVEYQVWGNDWKDVNVTNKKLADAVREYYEDGEINGAPYLVIGTTYRLDGFDSKFEEEIAENIKKAYNDDKNIDIVARVIENDYKLPKDLGGKSDIGTYIGFGITALVIGGFIALIFISRKEN